MDFLVCLFVSIDTSKCGRQIVLFFGQETVLLVVTCEILLFIYLFIYLKKEAFIVEERFWNWYVNVAQKIFLYFVILRYIQ